MPGSLFARSCARCHARARILSIPFLILLHAVAADAQELMPASSAAWASFAARAASTPGFLASSGGSGYALEIHGNNVPNVYGGWRTRLNGLTGGTYYRFRARAVARDIASPRESVTILLRWRGAFGDEVLPDYVWDYRVLSDDSLQFDRTIQAPPGTSGVDVELVLQWAPTGSVRFDALSFTPAAAPAPRTVKAASVYYRPSGTSNGLESVQRAARYGEEVAAAHRPDVMVFGELLNVIGAPGTYDAKAEPIPGPSTDVMAGLARAYNVNVVFGMLERHNQALYNTAVFLDRSGNVAGKYRKMQLPLSEAAVGIAPGSEVPVFDADFGRVALLICQDIAFPEPAREAAIKGAEMLLLPIWGGKSIAVQARAIEQSMYVVASGYDYVSDIVDPLGTVLDSVDTLAQPGVAIATIDLGKRFREIWLGDWRDSTNKQRRITAYTSVEPPPQGGGDPPPPPPDTAPPSVSMTSPASGATVSGAVAVAATATDNVGVVGVRFLVDGVALGTDDTTAPYSTSWDSTTAANGTHTVTATAYDAAGNSASASATVTVANGTPPPGSTPFTGTPISLPGRFEAEDFDHGGANVAYFDTTAGNRTGLYRQTDVDLEPTADTGAGYDVGWMKAGEWLNYTVNVPAAGTYTLRVRVAASGDGGRFHVESNGVDRTGPMIVPNTGGWQTWATIAAPITLPAGRQLLRFVVDAESPAAIFGNVNWLEVASAPAGSTPFTGTPVPLPGRIEAEAFDNGGANVAYRDTTAGNAGGAFRATDVDVEPTADAGAGYDVGWIKAGEWLHYSVNVAAAGTYTLRVRVAAPSAGGRFHLESHGVDRTGPMSIPSTGGWQLWTTVTATVTLPAGPQVLRLVVDTENPSGIFGNINWIELVSGGG